MIGSNRHDYRGDTVRLSPSGKSILATTRGMTNKTKGFVTSWSLDFSRSVEEGPLVSPDEPLDVYQTPTSGGKANAIEWAPRYHQDEFHDDEQEQDLLVLTDDEQGYLLVMEWDGNDLKEMARSKLPGKDGEGNEEGASHAVWLS